MAINSLTTLHLRTLRPGQKPRKLSDGGGLYMLLRPNGSAAWQLAYRFAGKQKTLSIGPYPAVTLQQARKKREEAKAQLAANEDPGVLKRIAKLSANGAAKDTFRSVALEWLEKQRKRFRTTHYDRIERRLERDLFPYIGKLPITTIEPPILLSALQRVERRGGGTSEMPRRARQTAGQVFRYAIATGRVMRDPTADLRDALEAAPRVQHRAKLEAGELPTFLSKLGDYNGQEGTTLGLELILRTMVRTVEARFARWSEFSDLTGPAALWRIPPERTKLHREHLVPLAPQVVRVLERLRELSRRSEWVFPARTQTGVVSENTFIYALYRMGYHGRASVHGFRRTASTILNEREFNKDWIERQLSHADRDGIRDTYNSAQWLNGRRQMLCWWSDYLDAAKETGDLIG